MILGTKILLDLVKKQKLVEGLSKRELTNPEGAVFDLCLGEVYSLHGGGFLGVDERSTPEMKLEVKYNPGKKEHFIFKPHVYYVVKTIESVNTPENIVGLFWPRSTLFRSGVTLDTGVDNPGYNGPLNMGIINNGEHDFEMELGARFVSVIFFEVAGEIVSKYRGQWQGGRTHVAKREKQV